MDVLSILFSRVKKVTFCTTSAIQFPLKLALLIIAPPKAPGTLQANSKPLNSLLKAILLRYTNKTPASTFTILSENIIFLKPLFRLITKPLIPLSKINKFVPFPITRKGILYCLEIESIFFKSSILLGLQKTSAGPPILNEV